MKLAPPRLITGVAALCIALTACGDSDMPTSPAAAGPGGASFTASGGPDLSAVARYDSPPSIAIAWAKKWIGPAGGRLEFQGFAIDVPAGAVSRVTQFSIQLPVDPNAGERVLAEFGPHQAFAVPVAIELPYAGTSVYGAGATVGWWDDGRSAWVDFGGTATPDGERIRTTTDHFSTYATMESGGDTVILSGG
jgi:hypothetical protein